MDNHDKQMLDELKSLKESPLFNLFLSSKELFHTNFLKWYFERCNPEAIRSVFKGIIDIKKNIDISIEYLREKNHIDLTINIYNDTSKIKENLIQTIIVENKFKSIPIKSQLVRYAEENTSDHVPTKYILLSLTKPSFKLENCENTHLALWKYISYKDLVKKLREVQKVNSQAQDEYYKNLVEDYCDFVSTLNEITEKFINSIAKDNRDFLNHDTKFWKELKKNHLHDLFDKIRYSFLAGKLYDQIIMDRIIPKEDLWEANIGDVHIGHSFTRTTGITGIDILCRRRKNKDDPGVAIGIQVQDRDFKIVINSSAGFDKLESIGRYLLNNEFGSQKEHWFDFNDIPDPYKGSKIYPLNPKKKNKEFNKYGSSFLYKRVRLDGSIALQKLIDLIMMYTKRAIRISKDDIWKTI